MRMVITTIAVRIYIRDRLFMIMLTGGNNYNFGEEMSLHGNFEILK